MKRSSAQAHAKHAYYCTCGQVVHGNGAKAKHRDMHDRKQDGHHYLTHTAWATWMGLDKSDRKDMSDEFNVLVTVGDKVYRGRDSVYQRGDRIWVDGLEVGVECDNDGGPLVHVVEPQRDAVVVLRPWWLRMWRRLWRR